MALDSLVLVDSAIRWERGLSFGRSEWLACAAVFLAGYAAFSLFATRRDVPLWITLLVGFLIGCVSFGAAATGTGAFDWGAAPLIDFSIGAPTGLNDWLAALGDNEGFPLAGWVAILQTLIVLAYKRSASLSRLKALASVVLALGLAFIVMAAASPVEFVYVPLDPRVREVAVLEDATTFRQAMRFALAGLGALAILGAGIAFVRSRPRRND